MGAKTKKYRLLIVAHPDDETLWFTGLLLKTSKFPWKLVIVTDANADGMGKMRMDQARRAARKLKIKDLEFWQFPDVYERRLDTEDLERRLKDLPEPKEVYTHSVVGDYGHPHHQDVSYAVHLVFKRVWSVAYNSFPQKKITLNHQQYKIKTEIIGKIYQSETNRFLNFLPCQAVEFFSQVERSEAVALYEYYVSGKNPDLKTLKKYRWLWPYIESNLKGIPERRF